MDTPFVYWLPVPGSQLKKDAARPIHRESILATSTSSKSTTWSDSPHGTQTTSTTTAHPTQTEHRAKIATPRGHRVNRNPDTLCLSFFAASSITRIYNIFCPVVLAALMSFLFKASILMTTSCCRMQFLQLRRVATISLLHPWNMFYLIVPLMADKFKETGLNFNKARVCDHWGWNVAILKILTWDRCWTSKFVNASDWKYKFGKLTWSTAVMDWKYLKTSNMYGSFLVKKPRLAEFAKFLAGGVDVPLPFPVLSEPPCSMEDLWHALRRMKANLCDDDAGLVAERINFL